MVTPKEQEMQAPTDNLSHSFQRFRPHYRPEQDSGHVQPVTRSPYIKQSLLVDGLQCEGARWIHIPWERYK